MQKFIISRDDTIYEAFPDVALTPSGKLICTFAECTHHGDRSYTRIMLSESTDRGRTWSPKRPLTEATRGWPAYNCPRITQLRDGRLVIVVDKLYAEERSHRPETCKNMLYFSTDEGQTWSDPVETPALGIVPDRLCELSNGRWLLACHYRDVDFGYIIQRLWASDDQGATWCGPTIVGKQAGLNLCEVSILPYPDGTLVAFMRENSGLGWDCYKALSHDNGGTWSEPIAFPLPGCHRPVAGWLNDGRILITHRFMQGGLGWVGWWTQNFFAALTDADSALAPTRAQAHTRILPVDFDRSPASDTGYSGWVQFADGEIYIVNYILDDAPKGQIRGYSLRMEDFLLESS
jgi:hypothetical protein